MGSEDVGQLAALGGLPAYQEHQFEVGGGAFDALRPFMPDLQKLGSSNLKDALASAFTWLAAFNSAKFLDDQAWFTRLSHGIPRLPFGLDVVGPQAQVGNFEAVLQYYPETFWDDLAPKGVVRLLAEELGLDLADVGLSGERSPWSHLPVEGTLRLPPEFFRRHAPLSLLVRALLKLSNAYDDKATRPKLRKKAAELAR